MDLEVPDNIILSYKEIPDTCSEEEKKQIRKENQKIIYNLLLEHKKSLLEERDKLLDKLAKKNVKKISAITIIRHETEEKKPKLKNCKD